MTICLDTALDLISDRFQVFIEQRHSLYLIQKSPDGLASAAMAQYRQSFNLDVQAIIQQLTWLDQIELAKLTNYKIVRASLDPVQLSVLSIVS